MKTTKYGWDIEVFCTKKKVNIHLRWKQKQDSFDDRVHFDHDTTGFVHGGFFSRQIASFK